MALTVAAAGAVSVARAQSVGDFSGTSYAGNDAYYTQGKDDAPSPSDKAAPPAAPAPAAPAGGGGCGCDGNNDGCCDNCGCQKCCCSTCGHECGCELDCGEPCVARLFDHCCWMNDHGIKLYGWVAAGITGNADNPVDNFNGPVTFNDRTEGQLNQLYLVLERAATTGECCWDWGGRVDLLYGTDHRFTMARGLETTDDFGDRWNSGRFYGLAMPQAYLDLAYNDLLLRFGHFYTIIGYEGVMAPNQFFYSHAYTHMYGEPFTHTGALAIYKVNDGLSVTGGVHRGWENWEDDENDELDFIGGVTFSSSDKKTSLALALTAGEEPSAIGFGDRTMYSIVFSHKFGCDRWTYVFQQDTGWQDDAVVTADPLDPVQDAEWYGINQYLFYQLNCCWSAGFRFEWFRDDDATRVTGLGDGNSIAGTFFEGDFWAMTVGLNWKPNDNLVIRPELRYDWFEGTGTPYNDGTETEQFLFAVDAIIHF
jgi:hypothetical protein